jgi:hypothetical protein
MIWFTLSKDHSRRERAKIRHIPVAKTNLTLISYWGEPELTQEGIRLYFWSR